MGSDDPEQWALIQRARAAHREHRYDTAYAEMRAARELGALDPHDLHLLADAAWWLGLMSDCMRLTELAHREYLSMGHLDRAAVQALDLGGMLLMRGEPALASGWLSRARRLLAGLPVGPAHGTLWFVDMSFALEQERLEDAERIAGDLRRLGAEHDQDHLLALGHLGAGLAQLRRGRTADAFARMEEATLLVVGGQVAPEWAGNVLCTVVSSCLDAGDPMRARQWSTAAYRWLADFEHAVMFTGVCRAHDVDLLVAEGDWTAAEEKAALVVRDLAELNVAAVAEAQYQLGECRRLRGELAAAAATYDRAAGLGRDPQPGAALLALASGHADAAWEAISDAAARAETDPFRSARILPALVEIGTATGQVDAAAAAALRLRELADTFGTPAFQASASLAEGRVELARGDAAAAIVPLTDATTGYRRIRAWYDTACTELLLAGAYAAIGDAVRARGHRAAGEAVRRRIGVPLESEPPVPRPRPGHDGPLTTREVEVLCRVARGGTNREVATELSISEATVRRHLANIYLKLGVGSRTAAAAWAHQNGLVPHAPA